MKSSRESLIELNTKLINQEQYFDSLSLNSNSINLNIISVKPVNNDNSNNKNTNNLNKDKEHFTENIYKYINLNNSKSFTFLLIFIFLIYHSILNSFYGINSCNRLLQTGEIRADKQWQPIGCMMHKYDQYDTETCFKYVKYYNGKNNFVFIGDSRIRQIFQSFVSQFDKEFKHNDYQETVPNQQNMTKSTLKIHKRFFSNSYSTQLLTASEQENIIYTNKSLNLQIEFIWKPILDESLINLVESYLLSNEPNPSFIVMGMASNYMKPNSSKESIEWFKGNLTNLVDIIKSLNYDLKYSTSKLKDEKSNTDSTQILTKELNNNQFNNNNMPSIYWMLQDPVDEYKIKLNKTFVDKITNYDIDLFNKASVKLLYHSSVNIWYSNRLVSNAFKDSIDGFQIGNLSLNIDSQILLNTYCNNLLNFDNGSCCTQSESMSLIQQIMFSIYLICFIITASLVIYKYFCKNYSQFRLNISGSEISLTQSCKNAASSKGFYDLFKTFSKFSIIMLYFFASDRLNFFMKENKHFTYITFLIPFIYVTIIGFFFQENLPLSKVMNRFQTDELKGFMQMMILFYRFSNAEQSIGLYLLIRLFTSSYLFLSGYGHFMYYWNTSNYSIMRFFEVLFRLNFLPVMLCFTMNRMYQFYSFIPLITFWFVCSYILMVVYPRISANSAKDNPLHFIYMIVKLLIFIGLITGLNLSDSLFEKVFIARPWKFLFVSTDDLIIEWRKRWSSDCYSFVFGMIFALVICILKYLNLIDDYENNLDQHEDDNLEFREKRRDKYALSKTKKLILVFISLIGLISYLIFAILCKTKENCDYFTQYVTFIPIVSYFILRNTLQFMREKCSFMFSWLGKISLELFICSYHIWLSADSNGVLVLLPGYQVLNLILTTFIFVCISHEINRLTKILSEYVVPNNWRICLRNFLSFVILLMPIAIKYGYI